MGKLFFVMGIMCASVQTVSSVNVTTAPSSVPSSGPSSGPSNVPSSSPSSKPSANHTVSAAPSNSTADTTSSATTTVKGSFFFNHISCSNYEFSQLNDQISVLSFSNFQCDHCCERKLLFNHVSCSNYEFNQLNEQFLLELIDYLFLLSDVFKEMNRLRSKLRYPINVNYHHYVWYCYGAVFYFS